MMSRMGKRATKTRWKVTPVTAANAGGSAADTGEPARKTLQKGEELELKEEERKFPDWGGNS